MTMQGTQLSARPFNLVPSNTFVPYDPEHKGNVFAREFNKAGKSVKA
jgi:hypothetical protein